MKNPSEMTNEQLVKWMDKTMASMPAAEKYGRKDRKYELIDRHWDLKEEMVERGIWVAFCDERGLCPTHDGRDCYA